MKLGNKKKYSSTLLESAADGLLRPLPVVVPIKMTVFRGSEVSWEFIQIPANSPLLYSNSSFC
jgi:hypothetical protein